MEPSGAPLEGQLVKRENAEERDGTQVFPARPMAAAAGVAINLGGLRSGCQPAGGGDDDDDGVVPRESDDKAVMELDLIEGSVATAAAAALASAATKAKVRRGD